MKKVWSLILMLAISLALAGCSSGGDSTKKEIFDVTKFPENQELALDATKNEVFQILEISEENQDFEYGFDYKNPKTVNINGVECSAYYIFYNDDKPSRILYDAKATDDNRNGLQKFFEDNYGNLEKYNENNYPNASFSFREEDNLDVRVIKGEEYDWVVYVIKSDEAARLLISRIC